MTRTDYLEMKCQCRSLADGASPEAREALEEMASSFNARANSAPTVAAKPARELILAAAVLTVVGYFLIAYYLKATHVERSPKGINAFLLFKPFPKTGKLYAAHAWLPAEINQVVVYENTVAMGEADKVYNDPGRTFIDGGRQWKYIEFASDNDPNTSGHSYWAVRLP